LKNSQAEYKTYNQANPVACTLSVGWKWIGYHTAERPGGGDNESKEVQEDEVKLDKVGGVAASPMKTELCMAQQKNTEAPMNASKELVWKWI
jgi:hypothetical protein